MSDLKIIVYCETRCRAGRLVFPVEYVNRMLALAGEQHQFAGRTFVVAGQTLVTTAHEDTMLSLCNAARRRLRQPKLTLVSSDPTS